MREFYEFAADHHGVFTRSEALERGVTASRLASMLRRGEVVRTYPSTYRLAGSSRTWDSKLRGAVASTEGVASHRAAAAVWQIDGFSRALIEVTIPESRALTLPGVKIRRSRQWAQCGFVEINGILTTGIDRTILDLAAVVSPTKLNHAVDAVIRQKLTTWPDLYHVLVIHSRRGRNGCGPLRKILDARFGDTAIPDSRWNRNVGSLLFDAGLPEPEYEYEITGSGGEFVARVDLAYPNDRVAIELDSVRWHLNHASFRDDPRRKNKLMLEGWTVLTFTWSDYVDTPNDLVRTVRIARSSKPEAA